GMKPYSDEAARFLAVLTEQLRKDERLTLVATGPLTNIAALLTHYPRVIGRIDKIVFMGGWSSEALPEGNLLRDPDAVSIVLGSGLPLTAVGYEVTRECVLRRPQILQLKASAEPGPKFLHALYLNWVRRRNLRVPP